MAWHRTNCQSTVMFVTTRVHVYLKSYNFRSNFEHSNLIIRTKMYTKISGGFYWEDDPLIKIMNFDMRGPGERGHGQGK